MGLLIKNAIIMEDNQRDYLFSPEEQPLSLDESESSLPAAFDLSEPTEIVATRARVLC